MDGIINISVRNLTEEEISRVSKGSKDFPQIAITLNDENNNEIGRNYMYPLRGYFFQIGGLDANGSIVQGHHFFGGAKNYIHNLRSIGMDDYNIENVFNSEASVCILDFIRLFTNQNNDSLLRNLFVEKYGNVDFRIDPIIGSMDTLLYGDTIWSKFINYTFEYFNN